MLAEIKPEKKSEATVADLEILDKQLKAFQERLQVQTILPPSVPTEASQRAEEQQVVNFGWEEIEDGPIFLPFITREFKKYVASHIVGELIYKKIQQEFSNEVFCMALTMEKMTQKEADTFNEINISHCDRSIVGNYNFKVNEFMIRLDHVKKLVEYFKACRNLILLKNKENNLFGFITIEGESRVPFIYHDSQKLVPLFYFEGHSDYLDSRSINLTDPFKIGYLKFCCKVQEIKKDFYEQNPLKVVDFEDVKILFPQDTTFSLDLPEKVNQDLLAPEIKIAILHGMENEIAVSQYHHTLNFSHKKSFKGALKRPAQPCSGIKGKKAKVDGGKSESTVGVSLSQVRNIRKKHKTKNPPNQSRTWKKTNNSPINSEVGAHVATPFYKNTNANQDMNILHKPKNQSYHVQISESATITLAVAPSNRVSRHNFDTGTPRAPSDQNYQVTNVPYQSPRVASTPGVPHVTQVISEARERVLEYPHGSTTSFTCMNNTFTQEMHESTTDIYPPGVNMHQRSMDNQQSTNTIQYMANFQQSNYTSNSITNILTYPEFYYTLPAAQVTASELLSCQPHSSSNGHNLYRQRRSVIENELRVRQQMFQEQLKQRDNFIPRQTYQQPAMQQPNSLLHHQGIIDPNQNFQNQYNSNPGSYFQQFVDPSTSVIQKNNVSYVSQNNVQNYIPDPSTSVTYSTDSFHSQNINRNAGKPLTELITMVIQHPGYIHLNPELYQTKNFLVKGKFLLGISKLPGDQCYLVNLSEFIEKVLGLNPFVKQVDLLSKFHILYRLNDVQKVKWDRVSVTKNLQFVGDYKDIFIEYYEINYLYCAK